MTPEATPRATRRNDPACLRQGNGVEVMRAGLGVLVVGAVWPMVDAASRGPVAVKVVGAGAPVATFTWPPEKVRAARGVSRIRMMGMMEGTASAPATSMASS